MPSHVIRAREPRGIGFEPGTAYVRDSDVLAAVAEDAAHFPGGHASAVATPQSETQVADILRRSDRVLVIGAQSSLTGGATPMGDVVVSTKKLNRIIDVGSDTVRVQAGVSLLELDKALRDASKYFPPVPTFMGAFVGGIVSTNAAGAATFKHGTTREWVRALTVVLATGDVLDIERGAVCANTSGVIEIALGDRTVRLEMPRYRLPDVAKVSAGYYAAPHMDLIDLFIGAEGTLGIVVEATLKTIAQVPATCLAFAPLRRTSDAMALVRTLRENGDVSAIEHMDRRCLELLREDGADKQFGVVIPDEAAIGLLITLELPSDTTSERAFDDIGRFRDIDTPLARFCRQLDEAGVFDLVDIAVPGDDRRAAQLLGLREAVPAAVNARVGRAKRTIDDRIEKTAADMIVRVDQVEHLMRLYDAEFQKRGLNAAVWGHISDGNLHPNVIPRSFADVESGKEAILLFGREVIRMGGSPLAEHGVGRNAIKQQLLRELYGDGGIDAMRAIKRALDPELKLGRGVLFDLEQA